MSQPVIVHSLRVTLTQQRIVPIAQHSRTPLHCRVVTHHPRRRHLAIHCSSSNGANKERDEAIQSLAADEDMELLTAE